MHTVAASMRKDVMEEVVLIIVIVISLKWLEGD